MIAKPIRRPGDPVPCFICQRPVLPTAPAAPYRSKDGSLVICSQKCNSKFIADQDLDEKNHRDGDVPDDYQLERDAAERDNSFGEEE